MPRLIILLCAAMLANAMPARSAGVPPPEGATMTAERSEALGSRSIATGPWAPGGPPVLPVEGRIRDSAWRIAGTATTLELLAPLRAWLLAAGYRPLYACETDGCGGYDFRYAGTVLPEPEMHVDLGDFRYLAAARGPDARPEIVVLWVSRSNEIGFVQITEVTPADAPAPPADAAPADAPVAPAAPAPAPATAADPAGAIARALEAEGHVALDDLVFEPGSAELGPGRFASLAALADWLAAAPDRRLTLVGHTDATGGLAANVDLSRARAASVAGRLVAEHGVAADRLAAEGAGYLAPRASNATEAGRARNRRVEAIPNLAGP